MINEGFAPSPERDVSGEQPVPFLPNAADSVALQLVLSPFP